MTLAPFEKLPPHDIEAEESIIAAIMVDQDALPAVDGIVQPGDFFRQKNGWAYEAACDIWGRGETVNQITMAYELARRDRLEETGGQTYLADIIRRLPTSLGVEFWAKIVKRDAVYRELISATSSISAMAYEAPADIERVLSRAQELIVNVDAPGGRHATRTARDIVLGTEGRAGLYDATEAFFADPYAIHGLTTSTVGEPGSGWLDLDVALDGFNRSQVTTVLADTSVGKSALVHWFTLCLAQQGIPVMIVTTEMSGEEVMQRLLYMAAGIDREHVRHNGATTGIMERVRTAADRMMDWPIYVSDTGSPQIAQVRAEIRRTVHARDVQLVVIDHIQHIQAEGTDGATSRLQAVTAGIKAAAMDEDVPVLQVSHVNRKSVHDGALTIHSGRDSISIEQDSNSILIMEPVKRGQNGAWVVADEFEANQERAKTNGTTVRVRLAKHRSGRMWYGIRRLDWNQGGRFVEL